MVILEIKPTLIWWIVMMIIFASGITWINHETIMNINYNWAVIIPTTIVFIVFLLAQFLPEEMTNEDI